MRMKGYIWESATKKGIEKTMSAVAKATGLSKHTLADHFSRRKSTYMSMHGIRVHKIQD
jgi:hypothetical protein